MEYKPNPLLGSSSDTYLCTEQIKKQRGIEIPCSKSSQQEWLRAILCGRAFGYKLAGLEYVVTSSKFPLRTSFREVSGRNSVSATRFTPERIARNQNIHLQPNFSAMIPARTGPKLGAVHVLVNDEMKGTEKNSREWAKNDTYKRIRIPT